MRLAPNGFTLIELVVTIGVFATIVTISMFSISQMSKTRSDDPAAQLESILATAARRARNGQGGTAWGVYLPYDNVTRVADEIILFSGNWYAARNAAEDISFSFDDTVTFTSVNLSGANPSAGNDHEAVFAVLTGETAQYGIIALEFVEVASSIAVSPSGFSTEVR